MIARPPDSGDARATPIGWWRDELVIRRFICDLIAAELAALRPTGGLASPHCNASLHLARDLGVDSLELTALATALAESIHLHESGVEDRLLVRPTIGEWVAVAQAGLESFSQSMTFRTSGSSGDPKRCPHTLAALWEEIEELSPTFGQRGRVISAVRSHHIYGFLFTVLLPRALGVPGSSIVDVRGSAPSSVLSHLREGDLVIGYPDFWRAVASSGARIASGVIGVTSTAPCPIEVIRQLSSAGLNTMVQLYGSSETAGVGVRTDPDAPYALLSYWRRSAEELDAIVRVAANGERTSYVVPDVIEWEGDRLFRPAGRIDHGVQVSGVNVFPTRVRGVLMEHPDVLDAAVRAMEANEPSRLKAFVVPRAGRSGNAAFHTELEEWVSSRLSTPERPKAFTFGESIPVDESGKLADWPVVRAEQFSTPPLAPPPRGIL